jgi:hypothetical protein
MFPIKIIELPNIFAAKKSGSFLCHSLLNGSKISKAILASQKQGHYSGDPRCVGIRLQPSPNI